MPGGGLYKRVAQATTTARDGPEHLLRLYSEVSVEERHGSKPPAPTSAEVVEVAGPQDVCDVQAFTVWYWTEGPEPSFVPETMYMNSKEGGHKTGEPRLIVSLSSFEALSQAYVMSVEKEGIKAALLQEKEDLLQEVRVGYYKELQHLRELLDMAKEQMALARGKPPTEDAEKKRMEEFERQVKEADVHYFNIVEYLEPELKGIMKDAVKQFNRDLMMENYNLRDRLALHEGTEGEEGLPERLMTLLMGKGTSPSEIVKILSGMITDKHQSDEFADACRGILGISKQPLEREESRRRQRTPGEKGEAEEKDPFPKPPEVHTEDNHDAANQRALMKEAQEAKDAAERLREEMARVKQQMEQDRAAFEQEKEDLKEERKKLLEAKEKAENQLKAAENQLKAAEAKLQQALDDVKTLKAGKPARSESKDNKPRHIEEDVTPGGSKRRKQVEEEDDVTPGGTKRPPKREEKLVAGGNISLKDLEEAKRKAEEAEAKLKELESRLREANKKIAKLADDLAEAQAEVEAERAARVEAERKAKTAPPKSVAESGHTDSPSDSPTAEKKSPSKQRREKPTYADEPKEVHEEVLEEHKKPKITNAPMTFIDRDYSDVDRSGGYSQFSGKPIAIVEEELKRERGMRINLEQETRKMTDTINNLAEQKHRLDKECRKFETDLKESRKKLKELIEEDESDGVSDIQIFCRWLTRRYGSLENGFRALDANRSGGLSVYEFCAGLGQMGWVKIVGRRLFKIIDQDEKGEIDMGDLHRIFERYVNGVVDDEEVGLCLQKAEADMQAQEKSDLDQARDRIRTLVKSNLDLEDENKKLKNLARKAEISAKGSKDGGEGMKNMERKNELMKEGYDKLRDERDEVTSKMTAAMWKCREAHILQVKYMRQAESNQEELKKLTRKYDTLRACYKKKHGNDPEEPGFEFSNNMGSIAAMSTAFITHPNMLKTMGSSFSIEEDSDSIGGRSPSANPDNAMCCPKCNAVLRLNARPDTANKLAATLSGSLQHSAPASDLWKMLKGATTGSGDEAGGLIPSDGEDSGAERQRNMSPEELINNMCDEDLLFGSPTALASMSPTKGQQGRQLPTGNRGAATYKEKVDGHVEKHGKKHRWQLLFADAQDRRVGDPNYARPGSREGASSPSAQDGGSNVVLSQESMNLLEHAKQVRGMWKEAVPIEPAFAEIDEVRRQEELRGADLVRIEGMAPRSFGVGGAPVSASMAGSIGGRVYLGASHRDPRTPSALSMGNIGSLSATGFRSAGSQGAPPPASFLEANNLSPSADGNLEGFFPSGTPPSLGEGSRTLRAADAKQDKTPKKQSQRETSPSDRNTNPGFGPSLQVVGPHLVGDSSPVNLKGWKPEPAVSKTPQERRLPLHPTTPPLTVTTMEAAGPAPHFDFENSDEGIHGHSLVNPHKNTKLVGSWNRSFGKGGELSIEQASPPQAIGAGLPNSPDLARSSPSLVRGGALRRVPAQLPTLNDTSRMGSKQRAVDKLLSSSMPDLGMHGFDRPLNAVRTPPLASPPGDERVSPNRKLRSRKLGGSGVLPASGKYGAGDGAAPFEAPLLYIGQPPRSPHGQYPDFRGSGTIGASHTTPSGMRNQFMMAAAALDLGSHVQRHAASEDDQGVESPLHIQAEPAGSDARKRALLV